MALRGDHSFEAAWNWFEHEDRDDSTCLLKDHTINAPDYINPEAEAIAAWNRRAALQPAQGEDWRTRFWQIVDGEGLLGLPSDEWNALSRLVHAYAKQPAQGDSDLIELQPTDLPADVQQAVNWLENVAGGEGEEKSEWIWPVAARMTIATLRKYAAQPAQGAEAVERVARAILTRQVRDVGVLKTEAKIADYVNHCWKDAVDDATAALSALPAAPEGWNAAVKAAAKIVRDYAKIEDGRLCHKLADMIERLSAAPRATADVNPYAFAEEQTIKSFGNRIEDLREQNAALTATVERLRKLLLPFKEIVEAVGPRYMKQPDYAAAWEVIGTEGMAYLTIGQLLALALADEKEIER